MSKGIDVSIIIVNYKTSYLINPCIDSIFSQTKDISYEIIIVDNNTEELKNTITYANDPRIKIIQLSENIGFGRANNDGVKIADGRNLLFLNPDTIILNNAIKILSDFIDSNNKCGICGGNLYDETLKPTLSYRKLLPGIKWEINELLNLIPEKLYWRNNRIFNTKSNPTVVAYITGADLMISSSLFKDVGGFCYRFFMYYEETDLCFRVSSKGYKIYSVPEAKIQHLAGKSFDSSKNIYKINIIEQSRKLYYTYNSSIIKTKISNFVYFLFLLSRSLLSRNKDRKQYYKTRKNIFIKVWKFSV